VIRGYLLAEIRKETWDKCTGLREEQNSPTIKMWVEWNGLIFYYLNSNIVTLVA
jgi:hypothetical protein